MFGLFRDIQVLKGLLFAGSGITISEIEIWTGWIELAIKFVSFLIILIVLANHINKYRSNMNSDGGDNEDGSGEPLEPRPGGDE